MSLSLPLRSALGALGALALLTLSACSEAPPPDPGSASAGSGQARIAVSMAALTQADVTRAEVIVTGDHIDAPIVTELALAGDTWGGLVEEIPAGPGRLFVANAYGAGDELLYTGQAPDVEILDATGRPCR